MKKPDLAPTFQLPVRLRGLVDVAYNSGWSWDPEATAMWQSLARRVVRGKEDTACLNPIIILGKLSAHNLEELSKDRAFVARLRQICRRLRKTPPRKGLFSPRRPVVYFSMEFAVHACLPFYAGGLGILAGDHLKSAGDLGLPLIGVGLAYRQGYFRQLVDGEGRMQVFYPRSDYGRVPIELVRDRRGRRLEVVVDLPARRTRRVRLRVWRIRTGSTSILLLDSDFSGNRASDRALTQRLYGGTREERIAQETLAGIGGVRVLRALGVDPLVWHLNEGHVTFSTLERLRELLVKKRSGRGRALSFEEAVEVVAADTVFTTHTPVPEGNEVFELSLARRYLAPQCSAARINVDDYLRLGVDRDRQGKPVLSMTVLAMRLSRIRNGVSQLHGSVSRNMWRHLWPGFSAQEAPITSITNGVHVPTWIAPEMDELFGSYVASDWRSRLSDAQTWKAALKIPDQELWRRRQILRQRLVDFVRKRVAAQLQRNGVSEGVISRRVRKLLNPNALTIGFARRFALYKRASLLFTDRGRARRLLDHPQRPVQIVFAGKPHPQDDVGKRLFERVVRISRRSEFRDKVVVLENYDMDVGRALVQGADVWLNNPRRPLEASGTSGQKVPFNGGLNVSVLDGWWDEAFEPGVGWAIGGRQDHASEREQDHEDSRSLYEVLSREVVPLFYRRQRDRPPRQWLRLVKGSMAVLIPRFNTHHMVEEYREVLYEPAAKNGHRVRAQQFQLAKDLATWKERLGRSWPMFHVKSLRQARSAKQRVLHVEVYLAELKRKELQALAYPDRGAPVAPTKVDWTEEGTCRFRFALPRDARHPIKVRFWPQHSGLLHFAESGLSYECSYVPAQGE